jgi:hypothetical protein
MSSGLDESEFDVMPPRRHLVFPNASEGAGGDELDLLSGEVKVDPFEEPAPSPYPVLSDALEKYSDMEPLGRVVRIDTPETFGAYVADKAVAELQRRVNELRAAFEAHESDMHGAQHPPMSTWTDIIGAAQAVEKLTNATTSDEAVESMPSVAVDVPGYARDAVDCWQSGPDMVYVAMKFRTPDGEPRIATMADRKRMDPDRAAAAAISRGMDPVEVLGALPAAAAVVCGNRLVRDVAGAAYEACARPDVCGMTEPVLLTNMGQPVGHPALAAMMHVQQEAAKGDPQARHEVAQLVQEPVARPLMREASRRLREAQKPKTFLSKYMRAASALVKAVF